MTLPLLLAAQATLLYLGRNHDPKHIAARRMDRAQIDDLSRIHGCVEQMFGFVDAAKADGAQPHEVIKVKRKAKETVDLYFDAIENVLQGRIEHGLVHIEPSRVP